MRTIKSSATLLKTEDEKFDVQNMQNVINGQNIPVVID